MTFAQRRNPLTTHFSERIPVIKWRMYIIFSQINTHCNQVEQKGRIRIRTHKRRPTSAQCIFNSNVSVTCHKHRTAWFPTVKPFPRSRSYSRVTSSTWLNGVKVSGEWCVFRGFYILSCSASCTDDWLLRIEAREFWSASLKLEAVLTETLWGCAWPSRSSLRLDLTPFWVTSRMYCC